MLHICQQEDCACFHHRLLECIQQGWNAEAQVLLQKLEHLKDVTDASGKTLLHYSVQYGNTAMLHHLIKSGCETNTQDRTKVTPVMLAIEIAHDPAVEILLKYNADVFVTDNIGVSAMQRSFYFNVNLQMLNRLPRRQYHKRVLEIIIEKINEDFLTNKERTINLVLNNANCLVKLAVVSSCDIELASVILQNDYGIDFRDSKLGLTGLHCAIILGKVENAKLLIECGADVNIIDEAGYSPLHYYTRRLQSVDKKSHVLKMILERSTNYDVPDFNGFTDLKWLLRIGTKETVTAALHSGINVLTALNDSSLQYVLMGNKNLNVTDIIELGVTIDVNLVHPQTRYSALMTEVFRGNVTKVEYLLEHGADVNYRLLNKDTALTNAAMFSVSRNLPKCIELLLQFGAGTQITHHFIEYLIQHPQKESRPIKPLVAHIAILAAINSSSATESILESIDADILYKSYFDLCLHQLEVLKSVVLDEPVTLFKLLHVDEKKLVTYARNKALIEAFKTTMKNMLHLESYYVDTLQMRLTKAVEWVALEKKVAQIVEVLTGFNVDAYHVIVYKIVNYLNSQDFNALSQVFH